MDVFIKDYQGKYLQGVVWPGHTVFPDFFKANTSEYWYNQIKDFYDNTIKFDGLWIVSDFLSMEFQRRIQKL